MEIFNDKTKMFTVPLELVKKGEVPKNSKVFYIKEKHAVIDKKDGKEYYSSLTKQKQIVYYETFKKRPLFYKVRGYITKDSHSSIAFCTFNILFVFFLFVALAVASCFLIPRIPVFKINEQPPKQESTIPPHKGIEDGDGITDIGDLLHSKGQTKTLSVPQFSDLYITKGVYIPLMNLPQNEILLMYEVYTTNNELVFASDKPIAPNSEDRWYLDDYEKGDYSFIVRAFKVDEEGNRGNSITFNTTIHIY